MHCLSSDMPSYIEEITVNPCQILLCQGNYQFDVPLGVIKVVACLKQCWERA